MADRLDPVRAGFAFANAFVNVVVRLPGGRPVRTAGRCGGMSYSVLDHAGAGRDVPVWPAALFAPERVPPDGHALADHLRARQLDSFRTPSALRFLTWSVLPDADLGPLAGVRTRTRRQLPGVLRALGQGRPVVLGMVVARGLLRSGDNHQVVATGATRDPATGAVVLTVLDPNTPRREVTLTEAPDGWRASNGRVWRGFFRHAYAPRTPPALPGASARPTARVHAGRPLPLVHVATGRLLVVDGARNVRLRTSGFTAWTPTAPGADLLSDGAVVTLTTAGSRPGRSPDGAGLALAGGAPVVRDAPDAWRVVVDGGGPWREGSRVRLVHTTTGALLRGDRTGPGTGFSPDASTWWTVAARS